MTDAATSPTPSGLLHGLLPPVEHVLGAALANAGWIAAGGTLTLGLPDAAKPAVLAALAAGRDAPVLVVAPNPARAEALAESVATWLPASLQPRLQSFPVRETAPYARRGADEEAAEARLRAIAALQSGHPTLLIADIQAIAQPTLDAAQSIPRIDVGGRLQAEPFIAALDAAGYRSARLVVEPGAFARRGGIIDIWPPAEAAPLRIELFGDEIESLRRFAPDTQRSLDAIDRLRLPRATEASAGDAARELAARLDTSYVVAAGEAHTADDPGLLLRDIELLRDGLLPQQLGFWTPFLAAGSLWDHLPASTVLVVDEPDEAIEHLRETAEIADRARLDLEADGRIPIGLPQPQAVPDDVAQQIAGWPRTLRLDRFASAGPKIERLPFLPLDRFGGRLRHFMDAIAPSPSATASTPPAGAPPHRIVVSLQAPRLAELLRDQGQPAQTPDLVSELPATGGTLLAHGALAEGWRLAASDDATRPEIALYSDTEIFGFTKRRARRPGRAPTETSLADELEPGDFVVHVDHGIAEFRGVVREAVRDREREYLELRFAERDRLLVPTDQLHRVQRYVGPSERPPKLTRLSTQQWLRAKERVRSAVRELAGELLDLYASRQVLDGIAVAPDSPWQMELEASFPFVETTDQLAAIRDVKTDMERARPMDRIVIGDVGYGKTEVAVRAAFKAVAAGFQVAVLVPTTVLAQQHLNTFSERLAPFPLSVEMLSRFRSPEEQRTILRQLTSGEVDIVVGTHRLLQKDVAFKNLGLLVIDEEQRFGVDDKEGLKRLRREVDVLTLSATPIPRSLHMAVTGIRDMSTIATPPEERLPITTYVMETNDPTVREAILREVERGGQVYFVHNRVQSIETIAGWLRELVPEARFVVAHGQMPERQLEQVMTGFVAGDADVLLCTTIIESGLDIAAVNTIIIHQAHRLGLAQLYQLRGRVGRSAAHAYAYLLYDRYRSLPETAQKRLQTIFDATELGAGFQIALRDLEIRGAGNLLGAEQSGQIGAVGFALYTQMLSEAVEQVKAQREGRAPVPVRQGPAVSVDLPLTAHIPPSYIDDVGLRLSIYQRLAAVERLDDLDTLRRELADRFGPLPAPVESLLRTVQIRALAARLGAESVQREDEAIVVRLAQGLRFSDEQHRVALPPGMRLGPSTLRYEPPARSAGPDPESLSDAERLDLLEEALGLLAPFDEEPEPANAVVAGAAS